MRPHVSRLILAIWLAGAAPAVATSLYVADRGANAVFRYPLVDGIPVATPAATLNLAAPPQAIAIGSDGSLYVALVKTHGVSVYAPGASGNAPPSRTLALAFAPPALALDAVGNLYAARPEGTVDVYSPGASGTAKPIARVHVGAGLFLTAIALDGGGRLFIEVQDSNGAAVFEFADPLTSPTFVRALGDLGATALGVDPSGELYVANAFGGVKTYEPTSCCLYPSDRVVRPGKPFTDAFGLALLGRRLYVSSYGSGGIAALFTLDSLRGDQRAASVTTGGGLREPWALAVGP